MQAYNPHSVQLTFASLDALGPCMIELCVTDISTVLVPSTATNTAAALTRFLGSDTLEAQVTGGHF